MELGSRIARRRDLLDLLLDGGEVRVVGRGRGLGEAGLDRRRRARAGGREQTRALRGAGVVGVGRAGLSSLAQRAGTLGGCLKVAAADPKGTHMHLELPADAEART